jgi:Rrf2 family protein
MDILRRNTDYALRLVVNLAKRYGDGAVSTRVLAEQEQVSYQLACKLMQQLHAAKLVESCMGPRGGFQLGREPAEVSILDVIETIQGPLLLNRCLMSEAACPRKSACPVRGKIGELQDQMKDYLGGVTLAELLESGRSAKTVRKKRPRRRRL